MKSNKGFGVVEIIIVVAAVVVLGLVGWVFYNSFANQETNETANSTDGGNSKQNSSTEKSDSSQAETKYLVIKEWQVKLALTDSITDARYEAKSDNPKYISLTTAKLVDLSKQYDECDIAKEGVAVIRSQPGDDHFGSPWTKSDLDAIGKKVGDYYYWVDVGQPCFSADNDFVVPKEISAIRSQLAKSIGTLEQN